MSLTVHQQITIHQLRVGQISNSSVLQVGAAGMVKPLSYIFDSAGFDEAPSSPGVLRAPPLVPLPAIPVPISGPASCG